MITRDNIVDSINFEYEKYGDCRWTNKELENAMVAAYNKALEDAVRAVNGVPDYYLDELNKLKI